MSPVYRNKNRTFWMMDGHPSSGETYPFTRTPSSGNLPVLERNHLTIFEVPTSSLTLLNPPTPPLPTHFQVRKN